MKGTTIRRSANRALHLLARFLPGATTVRPFLHRLRGVSIGQDVFIGDDVYLENEYPEAIEIQNGVQISVRAIVLAHTRGSGRVVIEKDAFIGPNVVIATSGDRLLRIGEGAVLGAGVVVTQDVADHLLIASEAARPVARVRIPLAKAQTMEEFVRGLTPIHRLAKRDTT
jgi:heptaprenylglycerol acetyltransferase